MTSLAIKLVHKLKREPSSMVSNNMELLLRRWCYDCCVSVAVILVIYVSSLTDETTRFTIEVHGSNDDVVRKLMRSRYI
jgi:hypothetical protein